MLIVLATPGGQGCPLSRRVEEDALTQGSLCHVCAELEGAGL